MYTSNRGIAPNPFSPCFSSAVCICHAFPLEVCILFVLCARACSKAVLKAECDFLCFLATNRPGAGWGSFSLTPRFLEQVASVGTSLDQCYACFPSTSTGFAQLAAILPIENLFTVRNLASLFRILNDTYLQYANGRAPEPDEVVLAPQSSFLPRLVRRLTHLILQASGWFPVATARRAHHQTVESPLPGRRHWKERISASSTTLCDMQGVRGRSHWVQKVWGLRRRFLHASTLIDFRQWQQHDQADSTHYTPLVGMQAPYSRTSIAGNQPGIGTVPYPENREDVFTAGLALIAYRNRWSTRTHRAVWADPVSCTVPCVHSLNCNASAHSSLKGHRAGALC